MGKKDLDEMMDQVQFVNESNAEEALEVYEKVIIKDPQNKRALEWRAICLHLLNSHEEAAFFFEQFLEKNSSSRAQFYYGNSLRALGALKKAEALLLPLLDDNNYMIKAEESLAFLYSDMKEYSKALHYAQKVCSQWPSGPDYYNMACYASMAGENAIAFEALKNSIITWENTRTSMCGDPDFAPIRDTEEFQYLMENEIKDRIELVETEEKQDIKLFPSLKESLMEENQYEKKLLPMLSFDGGIIRPEWKGRVFQFIYHSVSISRLDFKPIDGKYRLLLKEETTEEIEDFDEIACEPVFMKPAESSRGTTTLLLEVPRWCQSNETPFDPEGKPMTFVAQLESDDIFGSLYLFYSEKHNLVSQVFQCT
ncbi:MAG: tetratricopeptide repeat protein [Spirochaetales bacterium]|nr:tetratricopeptide repeat protein [Spirochaetales bacterium]